MRGYVKNSALIFIVAFNLRLGISSVPPVMNQIKASLAISNVQASLLPSIPVFCMGLFAFGIGRVQQIFGRRQSIFLLLLILGLATLSRMIFSGYIGLVSTAFIIGFSVAIIGPLVSGFIKEEFPNHAGLLIGIYSLAMGLGSVVASGMVPQMTSWFEGEWANALGIWGVLAVVIAVLWLVFSPKEKQDETIQTVTAVKFPLANLQAWKMVAFFALQSGMFYSILTWIAEFFRNTVVLSNHSVFLLTAFTTVQMTCSFLIPALMDRTGNPKFWIYLCSVAMLSGAFFLSISNLSAAMLAVCFFAIGTGGYFPIAMLLPLTYTKTPSEASVWTGMIQAFGYMIGGQVPVLLGWLIDTSGNYHMLFYMIVANSILLAIIGRNILKK
jgi:CP family cyanate transporter-like MFS transporter